MPKLEGVPNEKPKFRKRTTDPLMVARNIKEIYLALDAEAQVEASKVLRVIVPALFVPEVKN
jgi:hypothetical protein